MVEGALKLGSVYDAVLIIVEGVKHFSPFLRSGLKEIGYVSERHRAVI
jgi:hypothetical protein